VHRAFDISSANNNLIGELPLEIKLFGQMEELILFDNQLKGTIPETLSVLTQLYTLDVERNSMSGKPFVTLYGLPSLRKIHLSDNLFDEELSGLGMLNWELVQDLWLGNNLFRGEIPDEIGHMKSLRKYLPVILIGNKFLRKFMN
jgi:Leucine rich repeat